MYFKVYFILAHKKPEQLQALISLLQDGKSLFFIHLDRKVNLHSFEKISQVERCHFIKKRVRCRWGDFSLVKATLNGIEEIQQFMKEEHTDNNYHCVFLSGEDLPLKSNDIIHHFLEQQQNKSFMNYWKLPYDKWWGGGFFRLESLYLFDFIKYPKMHYWLNKTVRKLQLDFLFPIHRMKKRFPELELFGSSQWMILSKNLMEFVIDTSKKNTKFNSLFKPVLAPDELYFPTLIHYFQKETPFVIGNRATHLVIFEGVEANPHYLSIEEIQKNNTTTMLFARKFDRQKNAEAMDYIQTLLTP
jgi:hypothetical protein